MCQPQAQNVSANQRWRTTHQVHVLKFVPSVSSPSGQTTKEYLSRGPRKGRHWVYVLLPSPGTPIFGNGRPMYHLTNAFRRLGSTWPLAFCALGFLDPARPGSTYPRDHLKVAQGLPSCALPQVAVNLEENVSRRDGGRGTHFD